MGNEGKDGIFLNGKTDDPMSSPASYQPDSAFHPMDILAHMKNQERRFSQRYFRRSPQLACRRYLVDWLCLVAEKTRIKRNTIHLAVKLLDFFMDGHAVETNKIYLVAIACLCLAAKFEEKESKVIQFPHSPRITDIISCLLFC